MFLPAISALPSPAAMLARFGAKSRIIQPEQPINDEYVLITVTPRPGTLLDALA